jgi:UDP-N-acetylmuramoyl-L-alanyl-D-glutamate--2,6-diaminopimelate ligase
MPSLNGSEPVARSLSGLLRAVAEVLPESDRSITGIAANSRDVQPGYLFVAIEGTEADGHDFVHDAVRRGAAAIVAEHMVDDVPVPVFEVRDARRALASLAAEWYGHPADRLTLVGITGSLGKTSVLTLLECILNAAGQPVAAIGSEIVGIRFGRELDLGTDHTTPDPLTLHQGLRAVLDAGAEVACMEVTSHALDQERVHGLKFAAGIFTNLVSGEHLDYHGAFEDYVEIKLRFLDHLADGAPLIYGADGPLLTGNLPEEEHRLIGCGFGESADVSIVDVETSVHGTSYRLRIGNKLDRADGGTISPTDIPLEVPLLGRPHVLNSAFAATAALCLGIDAGAIRRGLADFPPPHRRMELLRIGGFLVLDDTAGHPDSVDAVFEVVDALPYGRLHTVAAVRGSRGPEINSQLALALAAAHQSRSAQPLIVTDSADAVDAHNVVSGDERESFLGGLGNHVEFEHFTELRSALRAAVDRVDEGDLLVLIGAQGMIAGADILRELTSAAAPHASDAS